MARLAIILRASAAVALAAALSACSAAPAASQAAAVAPVASSTASPSPTASEAPSPSEALAPTNSPAPKKSTKPLPSIDQSELDAVMTASITLIDLADADLAVSVGFVDPDSTKPIDLGTYTLGFTDQLTNQVPPGTYRLGFHQPADSKSGPTCTIEIGDGEAFTFAAIDGAIAISKSGTAPRTVRELFVGTSSLCGK